MLYYLYLIYMIFFKLILKSSDNLTIAFFYCVLNLREFKFTYD